MEITSATDAECFIRMCVETIGGGFHPDTLAADYVNTETGEDLFDAEGAAFFDARIEEAFAFCDPYEIALNHFRASCN